MIQKNLNLRYSGVITAFLSLFLLVNSYAQSDSVIVVDGHIYNSDSKKAIKARLTYEKLPFGDDYGITNTDSLGHYQLGLLNNNQYSIIIKAEGYITYKESLKLEETATDDSVFIKKDFFLTPRGVGQLIRIQNLYFDQGTSLIPEEAFQELNLIVEMLNEHPKMVIQLEGHTDFRGNAKLNYKLSEERVEAIRNYIYHKGIERKRVKIKAFGGSMPLTKEDTEEARKANRRVEVRVLEI